MSDLIHEARSWTPDLIAQHAVSARDTIKRLADRIESLEAERDKAIKSRNDWASRMMELASAEQKVERLEARLARVTGDALMIEHTIIGTQAGKQGAGQTVPEDLVVCAKCGWMRGSDYVLHLADAIRAVAADEQDAPDA